MTPSMRMNFATTAIGAAIAGIASFLLFGNPVGLIVVGIVTGILIAFFPSLPWFVPSAILWLVVVGVFSVIGAIFLNRIGR